MQVPGSVELFGSRLNAWTLDNTVDVINQRIVDGVFTQHVVVNVAKIVKMQSDSKLRSSVEACDIVNIDGMGVVWGARILGIKVPERVAGVDLFHSLLELSKNKGYPVFLLGAKDAVIKNTIERLQRDMPDLVIAGSHHGYFWDEEEAIVDKIRTSGAKLLFVAITSPKKENFINKWREQLGVDFVMGVGGTFDIVAGVTKRAPLWMQKYGLEWFYRVLQEPRRMWKRYLVTNTKFLFMLVREKIRLSWGI